MKSIIYLLIAGLLIILDQASKWFITQDFIAPALGFPSLGFIEWLSVAGERLSFVSIPITDFFNIVMVWNPGISFGLFNNMGNLAPYILSAIAVIMSIIFAVWLFRTQCRLTQSALSLIIAGALGNVIDRLRFGAVIDFLDVHIAGYHWPAFNLADSLIFIGVMLLIIQMIFFEKDSPSP